MILRPKPDTLLAALLKAIDIPPSAHQKAVERYRSLGEWFCREASMLAAWRPSVSPQGSFRLGTVIRPITGKDEYDIDLVCELEALSKARVTQRELKERVGVEVESYAQARGIKAPVTERKRAWRIDYADDVNFHLDVLACVPEDAATIQRLVQMDVDLVFARSAVALTCTSDPHYDVLTSLWPTSNPMGYGKWFEGQMALVAEEERGRLVKEGRYDAIEKVPLFELKTPLQRVIQILKWHRDVMFERDPELKPISILITTLVARAYAGERGVEEALRGALERMGQHVNAARPRVANPVNPREDFADKWRDWPSLEENFWAWLNQARRDFATLLEVRQPRQIMKHAERAFGVVLSEEAVEDALGDAVELGSRRAPEIIVTDAPKPWRRDR